MPSCLSCAPLVKDAHERVCTQCCLPDMQKPYDEATLRRWLAQMLLALDYLEQRGVLHVSVRDCAQCVCVCVCVCARVGVHMCTQNAGCVAVPGSGV